MTAPLTSAGALPLTARLEPWMERLVENPEECASLLRHYGSPVNVHDFGPLKRNIEELKSAAAQQGVQLRVYVARKANKTLSLIDAARQAGAGIDVSSKRELEQCLDRGVPGSRIILTAAVKTQQAIIAALEALAIISIDNVDELEVVTDLAKEKGIEAQVALRLAISGDSIAPTRFGLSAETWLFALEQLGKESSLKIRGIHFHLNGYSAEERKEGLRQALALVDNVKSLGHTPSFIDIGGGVPMRYLEDREQWRAFWNGVHSGTLPEASKDQGESGSFAPAETATSANANGDDQVRALSSPATNDPEPSWEVPSTIATSCWGLPLPTQKSTEQPTQAAKFAGMDLTDSLVSELVPGPATVEPLVPSQPVGPTWRGDTLGLVDPSAERPSPSTYPFYQESVRGPWLSSILTGEGLNSATTIAQELVHRDIELRCEPGRAVLDGCGMTLAEVAFRKEASDHTPLVGLFMNRTQLRTTSADYLADPIHIRPSQASVPVPVGRGFLVGAYCIEDELIVRRAMDFPEGVSRGDIFAFPNTAGYFMHIVESASHQMPLAANLVFDDLAITESDSEVLRSQWVQDQIDLVNPAGGEPLA